MSYIPRAWTPVSMCSEAIAFAQTSIADRDMSYADDDSESCTLDHGGDEEMEGRDFDGNGGGDDEDDVSDTFSWMSDPGMDDDDDEEAEGYGDGDGDGNYHAAETEQDTAIPIHLAPSQGTCPRGCRCLTCCRAFVDRVSGVLDPSLSQYINDALAHYSYGRLHPYDLVADVGTILRNDRFGQLWYDFLAFLSWDTVHDVLRDGQHGYIWRDVLTSISRETLAAGDPHVMIQADTLRWVCTSG